VCWSAASRAREQLLRTAPSHSPVPTATANHATRPIGIHHHASTSTSQRRRPSHLDADCSFRPIARPASPGGSGPKGSAQVPLVPTLDVFQVPRWAGGCGRRSGMEVTPGQSSASSGHCAYKRWVIGGSKCGQEDGSPVVGERADVTAGPVLASRESTSTPAADRSLPKRFTSWKPRAV